MGLFKKSTEITEAERVQLQQLNTNCANFIARRSDSTDPKVQKAVKGTQAMQQRTQKKLRTGRH